MRKIKKGSTDRSVLLRAIDSTDGTPETGIAYNTTGIDLWYRRNGGAVVSITEVTLAAVDSAHSDGGVIHIGNGYFRLDSPDAAFATGADSVMFGGTATGMIIIGQEIQLVNYDPEDGDDLGLTNLNEVTSARMGALTDWINGGRLDLLIDAIKDVTDAIGATGTGLSAIPWNSSWDAEVQSECTDALNAYDPPTKAELDVVDGHVSDTFDDVGDVKTVVDNIVADTNELQTDLHDGGRLDLILDSILADTNELQTDDTPGALTAIDAKIDVIDGIVDSILADTGTDGVVLADDAITASKFDESTAFPLSAADTGATAVARTGADSDTLETLSDQIDGIGGGGGDATAENQTTIIGHLTDMKGAGWTDETLESLQTAIEGIGGLTGSNAVTLTIQAPAGINIVGATVDVFDSDNTTFIGRVTTNSSGQAVFSLDDGTYTIRIINAGYTFSNQTLVVNGVEAETYTGTAYAPAAPAAANICRVYEYAYDPDGTPMSNVKAFAKINTLPYDANSVLYAGQNITAEYDSTTGLLYWDLVQGASVKFTIKDLGIDTTETIPASSTVRLSDI